MKNKQLFAFGVMVLALFALTSVVFASSGNDEPAPTLVEIVRKETAGFKDVQTAEAAGYGLFHGCVSGPQGGAMGIHYVNGGLVGDGEKWMQRTPRRCCMKQRMERCANWEWSMLSSPRSGMPNTTHRRC
jgi:hypothetical protein